MDCPKWPETMDLVSEHFVWPNVCSRAVWVTDDNNDDASDTTTDSGNNIPITMRFNDFRCSSRIAGEPIEKERSTS